MKNSFGMNGDSGSDLHPRRRYDARARAVQIIGSWLQIDCVDGRQLRVPLAWFPRLTAGTAPEQKHVEIDDSGYNLYWPDLDEDIEVLHLFWTEPR